MPEMAACSLPFALTQQKNPPHDHGFARGSESLTNFQYLNFTLPGSVAPNKTLLTVTTFLDYAGGCQDPCSNSDVYLDIRTPGSHFLDLDENSLDNNTYPLLSFTGSSSLPTIAHYFLYDAAFSTDTNTVTLGETNSSRVRGKFTLSLEGENLKLAVGGDYQAPNTTLTWTGDGSSIWRNYSTHPNKTLMNWKGIDYLDGSTPKDAMQYLDGDTILFKDDAQVFDVVIQGNSNSAQGVIDQKNGVSPASVTFDNSENDYVLSGDPIMGKAPLTKKGTGTLTLKDVNLYTGGTTIKEGLINFRLAENFDMIDTNLNLKAGKITLDGGGLQWSRTSDYTGIIDAKEHWSAGVSPASWVLLRAERPRSNDQA